MSNADLIRWDLLPDDYIDNPLIVLWIESIRECWQLAKGEHSNKLRGRYVKLIDGRGLHPFSEAFGRQQAHFALAELPVEAAVDAVTIRRQAEYDAESQFVEEVREKGVAVFGDARAANRGASR